MTTMPGAPPVDVVNELLACRACRRSAFAYEADDAVCGACGARYPVRDGVIDFVAGEQTTALDEDGYDAFHNVDARIDQAFHAVRAAVGGPLLGPISTALELGAGTGLFTTGMLRNTRVDELVVTDISPAMLRICRERVDGATSSGTRIVFATNNGEDLCAAGGRYDLVIGHFVVHHVLFYERTLRAAFDAIKEGGFAIFIEPSFKFHAALSLTLSRVVERIWRAPESWTYKDRSAVTALHEGWHHNLKYSGHQGFLSKQEDKHFFDRRAFESAARSAGWPRVFSIPFGFEDPPASAASVYLAQLGLTPSGFQRALDAFESELPGAFAALDADDAAPSFAFVLTKSAEYACPPRGARRPASFVADQDRKIVYDLAVSVDGREGGRSLSIDGWICAARPIASLVVATGSHRHELPVCHARSDVFEALAPAQLYPFESMLYSGVRESGLAFESDPLVTLVAVFGEGEHRQEVELERGSVESGTMRVSRLDRVLREDAKVSPVFDAPSAFGALKRLLGR